MLVRRLDAAGVGRDHGERVAHDEDADQILPDLGRGERLLVVAGSAVVVPESPIRVPEALVDERDAG